MLGSWYEGSSCFLGSIYTYIYIYLYMCICINIYIKDMILGSLYEGPDYFGVLI